MINKAELPATQKITQAAVGIMQHENGSVLLAERPVGKPWSGYWEFPGGKIEPMETPSQALCRELKEELGIVVTHLYPWITRTFDYPAKFDAEGHEVSAAKTVKLYFFIVTAWQGEPTGLEKQKIVWQNPENINVAPMLPANAPILQALNLPRQYAITNLSEFSSGSFGLKASGEALFLERLKLALENGLKMILVREKNLSADAYLSFSKRLMAIAAPYQAKIFIHSNLNLARQLQAAGVHFSSSALMQMTAKPEGLLCGASCHNREELAKAEALNLDYVLLSPVKLTQSHPEAMPFGWAHFQNLISDFQLPVYALGGMQLGDLHEARLHGAHGIAMQRSCW